MGLPMYSEYVIVLLCSCHGVLSVLECCCGGCQGVLSALECFYAVAKVFRVC